MLKYGVGKVLTLAIFEKIYFNLTERYIRLACLRMAQSIVKQLIIII
jgi:hypothetical protein